MHQLRTIDGMRAVLLTLVVLSVYGAEPLTDKVKKQVREGLQTRLKNVQEKDEESRDFAHFRNTCKVLVVELDNIAADMSLTAATFPDRLKERLKAAIDNPATGLTESQKTNWNRAVVDAVDAYEGTEIDGFDQAQVLHWRELVQLVATELKSSDERSRSTSNLGDPALTAIESADPTGIEANLYEKLSAYGVVYYDDAFRITCREMAAALESQLDPLARKHQEDVTQFKRAVVSLLWEIITKTNEGDDPSITAWKDGIKLIMNSLAVEVREAGQATGTSSAQVLAWKSAFERLSRGLKNAIEKDREEYARRSVNGSTERSDTAGSGGYGSGTSRAAVHHERRMSHIYRSHERRMYRIDRIRARY